MLFMPNTAIPRWAAIGQNFFLEAAVAVVERVQRHLDGVKGKSTLQHRKVYGRVLMAGKANEAYLPLLLGSRQAPPGRRQGA